LRTSNHSFPSSLDPNEARSSVQPLVWLLDVDCVPCAGARAALVGARTRARALARACVDDGDALVVPCVEFVEVNASPSRDGRSDSARQTMRGTEGSFRRESIGA